jgi:hypothetical protein
MCAANGMMFDFIPQVTSIQKLLKTQLLGILKHPAAIKDQDEICDVLIGPLGVKRSEVDKV